MFYFAELLKGGARVAMPINAKTLADAKRVASRKQAFYGTILEIGTEIDDNGFLADCIAEKIDGVWYKKEDF